MIIIGLQKSCQRKGKFEKALTTKGYKSSRIFWVFPLRYLDSNLSLVGKYPVIQKVFDTTRREISRKELVITEFQKSRHRKIKFEKALTSKGYKPSRICWDFPLCYLDIIPSPVGTYPIIQIVFDTKRREISQEELVITGFKKSRQSKGKLEKALTSKG